METAIKRTAVQKSTIPQSNVFLIRELREKHFDATWHAHQEYQLFLVLEGTGTRFIGNTVKHFDKGDLTFLGPNIPHLWRTEAYFLEPPADKISRGLVIYFDVSVWNMLIHKDEFSQVKTLLEKAQYGMDIYGKCAEETSVLMRELLHLHGTESIIQFFRILDLLSTTKDYQLLHNDVVHNPMKEVESNRINIVYTYVAQHFKRKIPLEEVSALLNMTPTSFSRYFTKKTSKSFSYFLTEVRIRNACKLLSTHEVKNIDQICYESGFNTLSNFNKQFKAFIGMTPKEYRQKFLTL
ncbi:AraC family transcriptional regulator [Parapedobacter defluvii]|uniref:AraC family transcriptional regulator n=1 Tax=Parapedobacter defluvii TaxID=2045106 RepID=A0ABQ1LH09_9SPHI|nr:AraC family transcriptional regulator [Parapedobacter defluvii]RQP10516.1 MAG: AraC family transcriptional regulator [Parapedobacter sp.]GGC24705.1 AraC family transcriptional regulator [Parapedobacter defluvii]